MKRYHAAFSCIRQHTTARILCLRLLLMLFLITLCFSFWSYHVQAQEEQSEQHQPFTITVSLGIIDIPKIDEPMETFDIDSYLFLEWNDPTVYEYIADRQPSPPEPIYKFYSPSEVQDVLKEIAVSLILNY